MEDVVESCEKVLHVAEKFWIDVKFFEIVTMIAFLEFYKAKCDYVILECGIGGTYDSTNIIETP